MNILLIAIVAIVIIALVIIFLRNIKKSALEIREVDLIKLEDIVSFFKQDSILSKLKENSDLLPVALKDIKEEIYYISLAIFNTKTNNTEKIVVLKSKNIDNDLLQSFGDKEMIILS